MNLKSVRKELDFNYKTDLADAIHLNIKEQKDFRIFGKIFN